MRNGNRDPTAAPESRLSKRVRLQTLMFTGAALGIALTLGGVLDPKLPPFHGE